MAVGTSQGTHFEDEFSHQAGIPLLPEGDEDMVKKPADTGDDNVLPPDEGSYDKKGGKIDASLKRVYITGHPENNTNDSEETGVAPSITDRLFGLNGVERYKTWPERMVTDLLTTAGKVSAGEVPMWSMTPDGEFHTSVEGLEAAHKLMPAANNLPVSIHMRGAGLSALEEYHAEPYETTAHEQFSQLLQQTRRQPSNIEAPVYRPDPGLPSSRATSRGDGFEPLVIPATGEISTHFEYNSATNTYRPLVGRPAGHEEFVQEPFHEGRSTATQFHNAGEANPYMPEAFRGLTREQVDALPDERFYHYGEYQAEGSMSSAQERRWRRVDRELADVHSQPEPDWEPTRTTEHEDQAWYREAKEPPAFWSDDVKAKITEAMKNDKITLVKDDRNYSSRDHLFKFASKDGIGKLDITEKRGGKELYVDIIGRVNKDGFVMFSNSAKHTFGTKEIKALVQQLKDEFPKAEVITGFRVSGARVHGSAAGEAKAEMRIPGRGKKD